MDLERAKEIVSGLADGIDPLTGEILPENHLCNKSEIIRALHTILSFQQHSEYSSRTQPLNAGKPWTNIEDDKLSDEFNSGMKVSEIAKEHSRSKGSIESRLSKLELMEKSFSNRR